MKPRSKKPRSERSLSATLALAFFTLSAVVLLIAGGLQILSKFQTQQETIANRQKIIAQDASKQVSSFVQEKFSILKTTARLTDLIAASPDEQKTVMGSLLGLHSAFRQLVLVDDEKRELARVSRLSLSGSQYLINQLSDHAMARIWRDGGYIGSVYVDPSTSEPMALMAVPIATALGDFEGVLLGEVNLKFMWDLVSQLKIGEQGLVYVVDRDGNLLAFSDVGRVLKGENVSHLEVVQEFIANPALSHQATIRTYQGLNGNTVVGTYVPLGTPDWAVVTEVPWGEAYRELIQETILSASIILILAVLAGFVGIFLARRLAVPLVNLTETATRISGGELELRAPVSGPKEIASLATAFNSMSTSLQGMIFKEVSSRAVLESIVDLYLEFVEQVGRGDLASRLKLDNYADDPQAASEPLYVLGTNLNNMVNSLDEMTRRNDQLLAETQLAREKAEEASQIKSQFLASMSHELRTPLNAILTFNELLAIGTFGPVNEEQVDYLQKSLQSGKHLLSLINDVLDVAKVQSGKMKLFIEDNFDVGTELKDIVASTEVLLKDKPVKLVTEIDEDFPPMSCDKRRIRQVLLNLVSNAVKFTEQGTITLSARRRANKVLFTVADTGPGITPEEQTIIFEPFIQTESGIRHAGGTGLGLPISKSLVEAHGGRIWVESTPGVGSKFYVSLPISQGQVVTDKEQ
jgi:signal transduction histidine kinase